MTLQIGILSFAHLHAPAYAAALSGRSEAVLAGIWDPDTNRGTNAATRFGCQFFPELGDLLSCGLDGVVICAENTRRRDLVERSAEAHVRVILCEKPIAASTDDAQAMIAACAQGGSHLATAFPCRYSPAFQRLESTIKDGYLGDVLAIRATNRGTLPGGWFTDVALSGGGAVIDHTVHVADLNRLLLGREAVAVYAETGNAIHHLNCEDTGFLTIDYSGGVFCTLDTSWSRPKTYPIWGDVTLHVVGTGGVAEASLFSQNLTHYDDLAGKVAYADWGSNLDALMVDDFLAAAAGRPVQRLATGEDGLRALEVALAAYRSVDSGSLEAV